MYQKTDSSRGGSTITIVNTYPEQLCSDRDKRWVAGTIGRILENGEPEKSKENNTAREYAQTGGNHNGCGLRKTIH